MLSRYLKCMYASVRGLRSVPPAFAPVSRVLGTESLIARDK